MIRGTTNRTKNVFEKLNYVGKFCCYNLKSVVFVFFHIDLNP